jgi:hypothetical protein
MKTTNLINIDTLMSSHIIDNYNMLLYKKLKVSMDMSFKNLDKLWRLEEEIGAQLIVQIRDRVVVNLKIK